MGVGREMFVAVTLHPLRPRGVWHHQLPHSELQTLMTKIQSISPSVAVSVSTVSLGPPLKDGPPEIPEVAILKWTTMTICSDHFGLFSFCLHPEYPKYEVVYKTNSPPCVTCNMIVYNLSLPTCQEVVVAVVLLTLPSAVSKRA